MPLHHGPNVTDEIEHPETVSRNARYGLIFFGIYLVLYGAFVGVNAFAPEWMEHTPIAGVNVAILSGFGLIVAAFVLALTYGWLCRNAAGSTQDANGESRT